MSGQPLETLVCERCACMMQIRLHSLVAVDCTQCGATIIPPGLPAPNHTAPRSWSAPTIQQLRDGQRNRRERDVATMIVQIIDRAIASSALTPTTILGRSAIEALWRSFQSFKDDGSLDSPEGVLIISQVDGWIGRLLEYHRDER